MVQDRLLGTSKLRSYIDMKAFQQRLKSFLGGQRNALEAGTIWCALSTELFLDAFSEPDKIGK
jgi:hypothetical protein